ncbi:MAG: iron-containing alcohol dehydrogenase, partial [Lachnospiraceae bacterium]|nr:iron-containing alcohol dehydrogenase [Lachnospiraceae bacterium]
AAVFFIKALEELCRKLKIPTLEEYGIQKEAFDSQIEKMSADALASGSPGNTIRTISKEDMIKIYKGLW